MGAASLGQYGVEHAEWGKRSKLEGRIGKNREGTKKNCSHVLKKTCSNWEGARLFEN